MPTDRSPTQDRILDAAEAVFASKGYRGGALNDVALAAGYTRAGLLHHFPSKEALLLAILERRDERLHALESIAPDESIGDVLSAVPRAFERYPELRMFIQLGHIVSAEASSPDHPAHDWSVARERQLREDLAKAVDRAKERGELAADIDSQALAALVLGAFEGLEAQWLLDDQVDIASGMQILQRLLGSAARV
ncbi:TetR/AcrR family transcriptional regulator [Actinoplanes sp. NPDC023936]|uniref:TetR/AcrR family transcriptional regulator n=1 Tax=Actinoplanes sp. NPDC023936 TaxID=3154910 RepID=UPI0033F2EE5C